MIESLRNWALAIDEDLLGATEEWQRIAWTAQAKELREAAAELERLEARLEVEGIERRRNRAMFEAAVQHLVRIKSFVQADDVVLPDGRRFKFSPPDALVREAWEALSAAIRGIDAAIDSATATKELGTELGTDGPQSP